MLLFFDQIQVIRPAEVENPGYHPANTGVFDLIPEAFAEIRKHHYEMSLVPRNMQILTSVLDRIIPRSADRNRREVKIVAGPHGTVEVPGYALLHTSKLNQSVYEELDRRLLISKAAERLIRGVSSLRGFLVVERRACNLVLALLADHYGRQEGLRTVTDMELPYIVNAFNVEPSMQRRAATMKLASTIIRMEIPDRLETMKPQAYVNLRKRYEDIRELFQHAVTQLCDDYQLAEIHSKKRFDAVVRTAAARFCYETEQLRQKRWCRGLKNWVPMALGVLASCCPMAGGAAVTLGGGISALLHVYRGFSETDYVTEKRRAQQLLGVMSNEFTHPWVFRRIS
jgi:hypothetical protein